MDGELERGTQYMLQSMSYQVKLRWLSTEVVDCLWVAARLATARQRYENAATRFGLADQVRNRVHYFIDCPMRPLVEEALETVRGNLDAQVFAEAFAAGQKMSFDEALLVVSTV